MTRIGVIGSGNVGQVLASGFLRHGYEVLIGSRDTSKLQDWKSKNGAFARTGSFEDAAKFGDIIILATKGKGAENALTLAGINNFTHKTIIDVTNPIDDTAAPVNGVIKFFTNSGESLMEGLQSLVPEAYFVKAFSSVGAFLMVNPDLGGITPSMFICGNNDNAKTEVKAILNQFGWETEDLGKANAAGTIENLCILWCIPGFLQNDWMHAFKLLRK